MSREIGTAQDLSAQPAGQSTENIPLPQNVSKEISTSNRAGAGEEILFNEARNALLNPGTHRPTEFKAKVSGITKEGEEPINLAITQDGKPLKTVSGTTGYSAELIKEGQAIIIRNTVATRVKDKTGNIVGASVDEQATALPKVNKILTRSSGFAPTADGQLRVANQTDMLCQASGPLSRLSLACKGTFSGPDEKYTVQHTGVEGKTYSSSTTNYYDSKNRKIGSIIATSTTHGDTADLDYRVIPATPDKRTKHK